MSGLAKELKTLEKEEEKVKFVPKPTVLTGAFLAEQIWDRVGSPKYCVYHFDRDEFEEVDTLDLGEVASRGRKIIYTPVDNQALRKGLVIVPSGVQVTTFKEALEKADSFVLKCYDPLGQESMVKLLTRITQGTWFLDRYVEDPLYDVAGAGKFAPILPIRGPSESGKNRLAFTLRLLSYRPYFEMSTYRVPSLYRPLDLWEGTLILDEADFANTTERSELIHFLNCRATGTPISRQDPKNPRKTDTFANFGITILTQRRQFDDNATESRCVPYYSEKTEKKLPTVETDEMLKEGLELQNMLLYLRMKHFRDVTFDKTAWLNDVSDPRLMASLLPLLAVGKIEPSVVDVVLETVKDVERLKVKQKAESEDGVVVNFLWEKIEPGLFTVWNYPHYYVLAEKQEEEEGKEISIVPLTTTTIAEELKWTTRHARKVLNSLNISAEGLPPMVKVGAKNWRVIFFKPDKLEKRLREFVVEYQPDKLAEILKSVTQVTQVTLPTHGEEIENDQQKEISPCLSSVTSVTSVTEIDLDTKLKKIRAWIVENKDSDGLIDSALLAKKIVVLGGDVQEIVRVLKEDEVIADSPRVGKWMVV